MEAGLSCALTFFELSLHPSGREYLWWGLTQLGLGPAHRQRADSAKAAGVADFLE